MKICAYVQGAYAKQNYANECMDTRQFVGLRVIIDVLERAGRKVEYAGSATVHEYECVLVSLTSDCDWWTFISERVKWRAGKYKVIVGGAGVLNVRPFLEFADYFVLGRGEGVIIPLLDEIETGNRCGIDSVVRSCEFSENASYSIAQAVEPYPHEIRLSENRKFKERFIGCNHRCFFCGYTWHRKYIGDGEYKMDDSLFGGFEDKERAMLDMCKDYSRINFSLLRTTAIDGMSERLRYKVNKRISRKHVVDFFVAAANSKAKPHQIKIYNIVGYPTETESDWQEFLDCIREADGNFSKRTQWSILLHCTPFRAMPATPCATWAMSYKNYRGEVGRVLGKGLKGNLIYQGSAFWAVEGMGTDSLPSVIKSAIAIRGTEKDSKSVRLLSCSRKYESLSSAEKTATLENYFDVKALFAEHTSETLPTKYLRTYCGYLRKQA
ncbi:MAG TPA: hypothetical protein PLT12_07220 [Kiritimatiellia bacterium]|nr:hypothetical protein [Kiritimatiellia bacterium]